MDSGEQGQRGISGGETVRVWWSLVLGVLAVVGMVRLRFDADPLSLLPEDLPAVSGLRLHQKLFSGSKDLLVTIRADSAETASRLAEAVASDLRRETQQVSSTRWQMGFQDALPETVAWMWSQRSTSDLLQLEERLSSQKVAQAIADQRDRLATTLDPIELARVGYDPLGLLSIPGAQNSIGQSALGEGIFSNESGTFRVVMVEPAQANMSYQEAARWLDQIKSRVRETQQRLSAEMGNPKWDVSYTGNPVYVTEIALGMESDLKSSVASTLLVICLLFWVTHRSLKPLGWLVMALGMTLFLTMALGALLFGKLSVISCGFAAVMMGLVVDYGLVGYQEMRAHPGLPLQRLRRAVLPGILWSAATTAGTFLALRYAGLPGLAELGSLTALGLMVGAVVMLFWFLPKVVRSAGPLVGAESMGEVRSSRPQIQFHPWTVLGLTVLVIALSVTLLGVSGWPRVERVSDPLLPRRSSAHEAMTVMQRELGRTNPVTWLLVEGKDAETVYSKLATLEPQLEKAREQGRIHAFQLPLALWPSPSNAVSNQEVLRRLAARQVELETHLLSAGFSTHSLALSRAMWSHWRAWGSSGVPTWPTNSFGVWISKMVSARAEDGSWVGLGTVETTQASIDLSSLPSDMRVVSWDRLGPELLTPVLERIRWLTVIIVGVLILCLWLAFRRWVEVLLALGSLALSFGLLFTVMSLTGATWNLLNLVAIPLLLGTSVDSTIHVQLAMRRHGGDLGAVWRSTGMALLLCAGANVAGFGSLAWSSNAGLASLDIVCAGGVLCVLTVVMLFLPFWWLAIYGQGDPQDSNADPTDRPSQLYSGMAWAAAHWISRHISRRWLSLAARTGVRVYLLIRPQRLEVVMQNLRPVLGQDRIRLRAVAMANFIQFAEKLVDLWRYESGIRPPLRIDSPESWSVFHDALAAKEGVLLVTVHLGNWELGGPLLADLGIRPLVLTASEPGDGLTEMRAHARAHYGVDTLVVGADPFAFVQVIRRLQEGGVVALLVDRPALGSGVEIPFFGKPYKASLAVAELARATGCRVIPIYIVQEDSGPVARALGEVTYQRADLATRERRAGFTQRVLEVFEMVIQRYPDQWFHFVPIWKSDSKSDELKR